MTRSTVDLREGGRFLSRMEARDGSEGFDVEGTYTRIVPHTAIDYQMSDGREVKVEFIERAGGVLVKETFDAETGNTPELQRTGWQAILDNFGRHVEANGLNQIDSTAGRTATQCSPARRARTSARGQQAGRYGRRACWLCSRARPNRRALHGVDDGSAGDLRDQRTHGRRRVGADRRALYLARAPA
jgi:hypothetical protein